MRTDAEIEVYSLSLLALLVQKYKYWRCARAADMRPAAEIEAAAKISWTGGPLYTPCCNAACAKVEATPGILVYISILI